MHDREYCLRHDIVFKFIQKVIHLIDRARRGILDGQDRIICGSLLDRLHGFPECPDMEAVHVLAKILLHSRLAVGSFGPLIDYPRILRIQ